jgi:hypothetical protein
LDSVIVPEVVSKVADTTTAPLPDFTVTKSMGASAENEIVVPRFPSTLGPATGDAQETLGLSTVRTLAGSPWLASASPEMLSPASTTTAMTKMRAAFGLPRRRCLAIRLYLLLCAAPAGSRVTYRTSGTTALAAPVRELCGGRGCCPVSSELQVGCSWRPPGGLWRRTRENQRTPPLHRVGAATTRQRTPEATQRQTSSTGRASGRSPALHDLLRVSTELAARSPYWWRPGQFVDARHSLDYLGEIHSSPHN